MSREALIGKIRESTSRETRFLSEAEGEEIVEGIEGPVRYTVIREKLFLPTGQSLVVYSLRVSGPKADRLNFLSDVAEDLGAPYSSTQSLTDNLALWEASVVKRRLTGRN